MKNKINYNKFWSPAFDTMEDFVFLIDKDFHITKVNKGFLDFTKGRPEDFIGKMCYEVIHDTNTPFGECPHARMLSSGKFEHSEFFEPRLKKWLYVRTTPIFDDDHALIGSIHMAADVTRFREAKVTIEKALSENQLILDAIPAWIFYKNTNNMFVRVNKAFADVMGLPKEQIENRPLSELYLPEQAKAYWADDKEVIGSGKPKRNIVEPMDVKGQKIWVRTDKIPYYDSGGKIIGIIGFSIDITERKLAENALRDNDEKIRLLLDSTAEAIYGLDTNGNCTFCNRSCLDLLRYKHPAELIGKNMHWMIHAKYPDGTPFPVEDCRIFQAFKKGEGTHVDDEVLWRSDGTSFPAEYWSYPRRQDGIITGAVVTFLDITERKKAEDDQIKLRDELEKKIASLERFQKITIDRELKMKELKTRIKELEDRFEKKE